MLQKIAEAVGAVKPFFMLQRNRAASFLIGVDPDPVITRSC
ncbi:hypothetical protein [Bradyrhizobium sp. STM 3562]